MPIDPLYFFEVIPELIPYIPITLFIAVVSLIIAVAGGLLLALCLRSGIWILSALAKLYISFFRAVPTLVQLFIIYYGLPQIFPGMSIIDSMTASILGLSVKNAAYLAEIFRAAITSVDKGQFEGARAVGMTKVQAYIRIILPQAVRNAIPATGNQFIGLMKETSLVFTLGMTELFAQARISASSTYRYFETFLAVAVIYWVMTIAYSYLQGLLEKKVNKPYES
ncbi:amino acid ABC transporter permease [Corticicoccus populi]|uniref:Amino acid ABC transporter permease n=1 Tax=Corticicoccus populi TaxID=1812821 RepID=A0ABW5WWA5_9STAP